MGSGRTTADFAVLGISSRCNYACQHCYAQDDLGPEEAIPVDRWRAVIADVQRLGVGSLVLSGGEPMLRYDDLLYLLSAADKRMSDFHLSTSGHGLSPARAAALRRAGLTAAGVSLDDYNPARHDRFRGRPGAFETAVQAIRYLQDAGVFVYLSVCLNRDLIRDGNLWKFYRLAADLNTGGVVLYEPKPCGGYRGRTPDSLFSEDDRRTVTDFFRTANAGPKFRDFPKLTYADYFESDARLGCQMRNGSMFTIDSRGWVKPCVMLPVGFGNILTDDFAAAYARMRTGLAAIPDGGCPAFRMAPQFEDWVNLGRRLPIPVPELTPDAGTRLLTHIGPAEYRISNWKSKEKIQ
jgi:MoaA/NifB/PqqE/SkfB family radical SAM enzyme